jgi:hypothetical protein
MADAGMWSGFLNIRGTYTLRARARLEGSERWSAWERTSFDRALQPTPTPTVTQTEGPSPTPTETPTITPTPLSCDNQTKDLWGNGWAAADVGGTEPGTVAQEGDSSFFVCGGGTDIWNQADSFTYVYQQAPSNFSEMEVLLSFFDGSSNNWSKAGPMIRDTLDAGSKHYMVRNTGGNDVSAQWRETTDGKSDSYGNERDPDMPIRMRLTKSGDTIQGWVWHLGSWQSMDDRDITFSDPFYIGFAITSHNSNKYASARIDFVSIK